MREAWGYERATYRRIVISELPVANTTENAGNKIVGALELITTYGPTYARWLQEAIDLIFVTPDAVNGITPLPQTGILLLHPELVSKLSPSAIGAYLVGAATRFRACRGVPDPSKIDLPRMTAMEAKHTLRFVQRLPDAEYLIAWAQDLVAYSQDYHQVRADVMLAETALQSLKARRTRWTRRGV